MRRIATLAAGLAVTALAAALPLQSHISPARALSNCDVADFSNDGEEMAFLTIINNYRAANGVGALSISQNLNRAAAWMAMDMGTHNYFGHTDSLGRDTWTRIVDCGYPVAGGENLAAGTYRSSAASAFELFQGSPSHNENMLLARYQQIGIARVFVPNSTYGWYWATTFGTMDDGSGYVAPPLTPAPPPPPPPTQPPAPPVAQARVPQATLSLEAGANFISWTGSDTAAAELAASAPGKVTMLYHWDAANGRWLRFGPGLPAFAQSLQTVHTGDGVWVLASAPASLDLR
ncbi:MAG: CAP domain-containing protein [Hyphomicrobiales bacterium]